MDKIKNGEKMIKKMKEEKKRIEGGESTALKRLLKDSFLRRSFPPCTILNNISVGENLLSRLHLQEEIMQELISPSILIILYIIRRKRC